MVRASRDNVVKSPVAVLPGTFGDDRLDRAGGILEGEPGDRFVSAQLAQPQPEAQQAVRD